MPRPTVYLGLANEFRGTFMSLGAGLEVPCIPSLARRYGVAKHTVRRALRLLEGEGLITRAAPHEGYVVAERRNAATYSRPYPTVVVIVPRWGGLGGTNYLSRLVSQYIGDVASFGVPVCVPPRHAEAALKCVPGGVALARPPIRASAVAYPGGASIAVLRELVECDTVVVTLDDASDLSAVDSVTVDCRRDGECVVDYLHELGHRTIALLTWRAPMAPPHWSDRVDPDWHRFAAGMRTAGTRLGLNTSSAYHVVYDIDMKRSDRGVRHALARLWRLTPPPTAIICFNEDISGDVIAVLAERGVQCPRDVSVVARGALGETPPSVTALVSDTRAMARAAAEHTVARLTSARTPASRLMSPSRLVLGSTTGPPLRRTC